MCIAISKPEGIQIFPEVLETCFESNPDGAGFAYSDENGKVVIQKGFFTIEEFLEAYKEHEMKQCLIHFRIKTHGHISEENCHPFLVNDHIAMIHNGVIHGYGYSNKSDTADFVETTVKPLVEDFGEDILKHPRIIKMIEKYIGYSKLMFLNTQTKEFIIHNEDSCNENSGVIFSNYSWQKSYFPSRSTKSRKSTTNDSTTTNNVLSLPDKRTKSTWMKKESESLTRWLNGNKYFVITHDDILKIHGLTTNHRPIGNIIDGDIVIVDRLFNDHSIDVINTRTNQKVFNVPSWICIQPNEDELTAVLQ